MAAAIDSVASAYLWDQGSEVYLHSTYSLASVTLTPLNLTPIRVTGTIVTGPRSPSRSPAWEADALTRRLNGSQLSLWDQGSEVYLHSAYSLASVTYIENVRVVFHAKHTTTMLGHSVWAKCVWFLYDIMVFFSHFHHFH